MILDALFELLIPFGELRRLPQDSVLVLLDTYQRACAREQLGLIEGFHDEVVRPSLKRLELLLAAARSDHHDGKNLRRRRRANSPTDLVPVHLGHDNVEQNQVRMRLGGQPIECLCSGAHALDGVTARAQHRVEQADVLRCVVNYQDAGCLRRHMPTALSAR